MWPQITLIALMTANLFLVASKHGERSTYNFWASAISAAVSIWLLWAGGFWAVFN